MFVCSSVLSHISETTWSEMVTSLLIGSFTFRTHFLTIMFYPLLLPVLNVNSVIFTLISSDWFYICFHSVVLGHL